MVYFNGGLVLFRSWQNLAVLAFLLNASATFALDSIVNPQTITFAEPPNELVLENGQKLGPISVVYETYGKLTPDGRNAVLIMGGLSETSQAAGRHAPGGPVGWWDGLIGPGKPFDTDRFFVISPQALAGGHRDNKLGTGTTGPQSIDPRTGKPYGMHFPTFSIRDMARVNMELLKHLGVKHLVVVSGVSMGGFEALEFICTFPDFVEGAIPTVSRGRETAEHILNHSVRSIAIMNDPDWQGGDYYGTGRYPIKGVALALMVGYGSNNNSPEFNDNKQADDPNLSPYANVLTGFKFERDLWANALKEAESGLDANCELYRLRAVSNQNLGWNRGDYSRGWMANLADGLKSVQADVLMMPFKTDDSVRPDTAKEIVDILRTFGKRAELHIVDSERGHGGASRDTVQMSPIMKQFIDHLPGAKVPRP